MCRPVVLYRREITCVLSLCNIFETAFIIQDYMVNLKQQVELMMKKFLTFLLDIATGHPEKETQVLSFDSCRPLGQANTV